MTRPWTGLIGVMTLLATLAVPELGRCSSSEVFNTRAAEGEVWVSVDLARHRLDEAYVPLLVVVRNTAGQPATLQRSSFRLIGADRVALAMPDLETLRKEYPKVGFDQTMLRFVGFPLGTLLDLSRLEPSDFFPVVGQGGVRLDHVTLPNLHWTGSVARLRRQAEAAAGGAQHVIMTTRVRRGAPVAEACERLRAEPVTGARDRCGVHAP